MLLLARFRRDDKRHLSAGRTWRRVGGNNAVAAGLADGWPVVPRGQGGSA